MSIRHGVFALFAVVDRKERDGIARARKEISSTGTYAVSLRMPTHAGRLHYT